MFPSDDHGSIVTFLVGLILLVMIGVGMSIVVDKRLKFSSSAAELNLEIAADAKELEELKSKVADSAVTLANAGPQLKEIADSHQHLLVQVENSKGRLANLTESRGQLNHQVQSVGDEYKKYRELYRRQTWAGAVGEQHQILATLGGQLFRNVTITRVTAVGLEIRHEDGIARIQAPDLDAALRDRFQWDDEERSRHLSVESAQDRAAAANSALAQTEVLAVMRPSSGAADSATSRSEQIAQARGKVVAWKSKVKRLRSEQEMAQQQARSGANKSVTGSLQTWAAKAARLDAEVRTAQTELEMAKAQLREWSPTDSALRTLPSER
jgi:chromosome segregation ATPase